MISVNNLNIRNVLAMFVPGLNLFSCVVSSRPLIERFCNLSKLVPCCAAIAAITKACGYFIEPKVNWTFQTQWRKRIIYPMFNKEMRKSFAFMNDIFSPLQNNKHSKGGCRVDVFCDWRPPFLSNFPSSCLSQMSNKQGDSSLSWHSPSHIWICRFRETCLSSHPSQKWGDICVFSTVYVERIIFFENKLMWNIPT